MDWTGGLYWWTDIFFVLENHLYPSNETLLFSKFRHDAFWSLEMGVSNHWTGIWNGTMEWKME